MNRKIKEAVEKLAGTHLKDEVYMVDCVVNSIDINSGTCSATTIGEKASVQLININLQSVVADGLLIIPVINSIITVLYSKRGDKYIIAYGDIDSVFYSGNTWQFGDGSFGGLAKVVTLTQRIQRLENMMNTHIHSGVTAGAGVSGANSTPISPITTQSDLENTIVKHGL